MQRLDSLEIDSVLRNKNKPKDPDDQFGRFFLFSDGKNINNSSGFRPKSIALQSTNIEDCAFCVLVTTFNESEWPDELDSETGIFTYFGDQRSQGELHETHVGGNRFLRKIFHNLHTNQRTEIPPLLVFEKFKADGTFMRFLGLAVPGANNTSGINDLVAVWRVKGQSRFQNYKATFTILREPRVSHQWLEDIVQGINPVQSQECPRAWKLWVESGTYTPLVCERKRESRTKESQMPSDLLQRQLVEHVYNSLTPRQFEYVAVEVVKLMEQRFGEFSVTRASRDGGFDAIGTYQVGHDLHQIKLDVFLEAKLWEPQKDIGVKPMSRLISRIKHRDIGVFVTTGNFSKQVQAELIEDNHPIILISGGDLARILIRNEINTIPRLSAWLKGITDKSILLK